jgi:hypothetical protein
MEDVIGVGVGTGSGDPAFILVTKDRLWLMDTSRRDL